DSYSARHRTAVILWRRGFLDSCGGRGARRIWAIRRIFEPCLAGGFGKLPFGKDLGRRGCLTDARGIFNHDGTALVARATSGLRVSWLTRPAAYLLFGLLPANRMRREFDRRRAGSV